MTTGCVVYVCVNLWKSVIVHYCQSYEYFMYLNETLGSRGAPIIGYWKYPISANIFHWVIQSVSADLILFLGGQVEDRKPYLIQTLMLALTLYQPTCIEVLICKQMMKALTQQ